MGTCLFILHSDTQRNMATASISLGPFLSKGIVDTWGNTSTDLSTYNNYALGNAEAAFSSTAAPAIDFIKALLIVVAFDEPTQAAIIHSGEATDKLIIMMLLSTVLFATMLVGKLFNWVYMTHCRSDNMKVSLTELLDQMETELHLLKEELTDVSGQPETP